MKYLGVDPGLSGGLTYIDGDRIVLLGMPESESGILEWFLQHSSRNSRAVIEQVGGWTGGKTTKGGGEASHGGSPGSHMFTFGKNYGCLLMALTAAGFTDGETSRRSIPRTWQKALGVEPRRKSETKPQFKARLCTLARELFPQVGGITLKTCDSLLIAEYCRRRFSHAQGR